MAKKPSAKNKNTQPAREPQPPKKAVRELPTVISEEDRLTLMVAVREVEAAIAREQLSSMRLQQVAASREGAQNQLSRLTSGANAKYNVVPGKDAIDVVSGQIKRG